jgi:putative molybdopterin biosynthesis protein
LDQLGISSDEIQGYDRMEYTHMAVAAAVDSGIADCGLGIHAAAAALDLDFIALFQERYDLVIPLEHYESPVLVPLLEILENEEFRQSVQNLPGYGTSPMGQKIARLE